MWLETLTAVWKDKLFDQPELLVGATIIASLICILVALLHNGWSLQPAERTKLTKSKSLCDVSEGLRKEELRSSSSCNSLANLNDDRVLSAAVFREFKVLKVTKASHNTKLIRFEIPHGKSLDLSIGRHLTIRARIGSDDGAAKVMRAYTPTSRPDQKGFFDILVKSYEYGKLSPYLHSLRPGSSVEVRGPVGRFHYSPNKFLPPQSMGLVAGGTGLTPCLQVIRCVLEGVGGGNGGGREEDRTCFTLLFQNRTESDILLKEELDSLTARYPGRLRVIYFLSNPSTLEFGANSGLRGGEVRGYINDAAVRTLLAPTLCPYVCVCGPSGFNSSVKQLLVAAGHVDEESSNEGGGKKGRATIFTW